MNEEKSSKIITYTVIFLRYALNLKQIYETMNEEDEVISYVGAI